MKLLSQIITDSRNESGLRHMGMWVLNHSIKRDIIPSSSHRSPGLIFIDLDSSFLLWFVNVSGLSSLCLESLSSPMQTLSIKNIAGMGLKRQNWLGVGFYHTCKQPSQRTQPTGYHQMGDTQGFVSTPLPSLHILHPVVCSTCSLHCAFRNCLTVFVSVVLSSLYSNGNHIF